MNHESRVEKQYISIEINKEHCSACASQCSFCQMIDDPLLSREEKLEKQGFAVRGIPLHEEVKHA